MIKKYLKTIKRLKKNERGVTIVYLAVAMPVFLGFAGLAFDASLWYMERRILQSTVDAATMAAAFSYHNGGSDTDMLTYATNSASTNNYTVSGSNTLAINEPPTSGNFNGQAGYIQGVITSPGTSLFSAAIGFQPPTINVSATATVTNNGEACMVALHETADKAIELSGSATVDMDCGVASNSNSNEAVYLNGNIDISAEPAISADGDVYEGGSSSVAADTEIIPHNGDVSDPYADIVAPSNGCDVTFGNGTSGTLAGNTSSSFIAEDLDGDGNGLGTYTLQPGTYCQDFPIDGLEVTLAPGQYVLDGADFDVQSSGTILTGDAISIVLTGDNPADVGQIDIQGGTIQLQAITPTDRADGTVTGVAEAYEGVLFYVDRIAPFASTGTDTHLINGNANMILDGSIYIPTQMIDYLGTTGNNTTCTQVIASMVKVSGNTDTTIANTTSNCVALGGSAATIDLVLLVE